MTGRCECPDTLWVMHSRLREWNRGDGPYGVASTGASEEKTRADRPSLALGPSAPTEMALSVVLREDTRSLVLPYEVPLRDRNEKRPPL